MEFSLLDMMQYIQQQWYTWSDEGKESHLENLYKSGYSEQYRKTVYKSIRSFPYLLRLPGIIGSVLDWRKKTFFFFFEF